jgi:hypothetical protein
MGTARFAESAQEHFVGSVQKKDLYPVPGNAQLGQDLRPGLKKKPFSKIDPERDPLDPLPISLT